METKHILLAGLAVADIPAYVFLFRLLFRGAVPAAPEAGRDGEAAGGGSPAQGAARGRLPRLGEIFDSGNFKDRGGEMKLLLLATASALLVLAEYLAILAIFPGLAGPR